MAITGIEQDAIIERLDQMIRHVSPEAQTLPKYGGVLYTLRPDEKEGQFCGVFPYKDHIQLAFSQGAALKDPRQVLGGTGKFRRHINVSNLQEIDVDIVTELLENAVQVSQSQGSKKP